MKTEKKIFVESTDTDESVFDRVRKAQGDHIVVNVARSSLFGSSIEQFQTLVYEASQAQKELTIESIDDHILELAALAGAKAINPIFMTRARAVTDIVPRPRKRRTPGTLSRGTDSEEKKKNTTTSNSSAEKSSAIHSPKQHTMLPRRTRFSRRSVIAVAGTI